MYCRQQTKSSRNTQEIAGENGARPLNIINTGQGPEGSTGEHNQGETEQVYTSLISNQGDWETRQANGNRENKTKTHGQLCLHGLFFKQCE